MGESRPQNLSRRSGRVCGSLLLNCFSTNYLCGFRVCFYSGWDVKRTDCLLHYSAPKYMPLGANLASAFSLSSWAVLSCLSQPSLEPDEPNPPGPDSAGSGAAVWVGGNDRALPCCCAEPLFSGPRAAFIPGIPVIRIIGSGPVSLGCFLLHLTAS